MYHITAYFPHGATADCQCDTLAELVAYLTEWLPLASHVTCREIPSDVYPT